MLELSKQINEDLRTARAVKRRQQENTLQEQSTMVALRRIRQYAREYQQEHGCSCDKALAEAVRLLELETIG